MCCFLTLFVVLGPRIAGVFWWIARPLQWVGAAGAFDTWLWPVLGLIAVPYTTLMYVAVASGPGSLGGWDWLWMGLGVAADIASYAGGGYGNRQRIPGYSGTKPPL